MFLAYVVKKFPIWLTLQMEKESGALSQTIQCQTIQTVSCHSSQAVSPGEHLSPITDSSPIQDAMAGSIDCGLQLLPGSWFSPWSTRWLTGISLKRQRSHMSCGLMERLRWPYQKGELARQTEAMDACLLLETWEHASKYWQRNQMPSSDASLTEGHLLLTYSVFFGGFLRRSSSGLP